VPNPAEDPVLRSSRREAIIVAINFVAAIGFTIGYCRLHGYYSGKEGIQFVYGFPSWVFWGVIVPWLVCVVFSFIFAALIMRDEDLGEDPAGGDEFGQGE
jgi:uncharacterized membrane protein YhdT